MSWKVYPTISWRTVKNIHDLANKRAIIHLNEGSIIDATTAPLHQTNKLIDPDQYELHISTHDATLNKFVILFANTRSGTRQLNPAIATLTILDTKPARRNK